MPFYILTDKHFYKNTLGGGTFNFIYYNRFNSCLSDNRSYYKQLLYRHLWFLNYNKRSSEMILFIGFVLILFLYQGCFLVFTKHSIINLNKYYMLLTSLYMVSIFVLFFAYYSSVLNSFFKNFVFTNIILIYIFIVFA